MAALSGLLSPLLGRPLLCLAVCWASGIMLAALLHLPWGSWAGACACMLLAWAVTASAASLASRAALLLAGLTAGAAVYSAQSAPVLPGDPSYLPAGGVMIAGHPLSPASRSSYGWHTVFRLAGRRAGPRWLPAHGDLYLYGRGEPPAMGRQSLVLGRVRRAQAAGNPYGFSWAPYLAERDLTYRVQAYAIAPTTQLAPASPIHAGRAELTRRLIAAMPRPYPVEYGQLFSALLLGIHGESLPAEFTERFRRAGIIHLMVVSGSQIALLATLFIFPLWLAPRGRARTTYPRARSILVLLSLPLLGVYLALADRGPSVDRAALMVLLAGLAMFLSFSRLARRRAFRPDGLTLLAAAALAVLVVRPALLFSPAMQLSFGAVLGLICITPVLMRLFWRWTGSVGLLPAATLGAQAMNAPALAWHFGSIPVLAPLTNLIAIPLAGILLPLGLLALGAVAIAPPAAALLDSVSAPLLRWLVGVSVLAARVPWAEHPWVARSALPIVLYLALVGAATLALSRWLDSRRPNWSMPAGREPSMW